jgi:hypothetical protein
MVVGISRPQSSDESGHPYGRLRCPRCSEVIVETELKPTDATVDFFWDETFFGDVSFLKNCVFFGFQACLLDFITKRMVETC